MIQWGNYNNLSSNEWLLITLPTSYSNTLYSVAVTQRCENIEYPNCCISGYSAQTTSTIKIGGRFVVVYDQSYYSYITIGY